MEFPGAVKGRGIEIDVIVNVALVGMGADEKLVFAFRPAHRRFKAQLICLLRRHLAGRERLPYLEKQSPALHGPGRGRGSTSSRHEKRHQAKCPLSLMILFH